MNRAGKIALGCLLAPIGFAVLGVFFFMAIRMAGVPEPRVTKRNLHQPVQTTESTAPERRLESTRRDPEQTAAEIITMPDGESVRVIIDMEEGEFEIEPGPAEEGFRVTADYDEATYELTQKYDVDKQGRPTYLVQFKSKVSFLRRIAQDGSFDDEDLAHNIIHVQLPLGTPMDLALTLAKAEAQIDLSGLSLSATATKFRMGEFRLRTEEPNPLAITTFSTNCSMGEFRFQGISNFQPKVIRANASMGEVDLDLGGALTGDTEVITRLRMGEMTLNLPEDAFWDPTSRTKASWGEVTGSLENRGSQDPETSPRLRVDGTVFMGELVVDSYRPRRSLRRGNVR